MNNMVSSYASLLSYYHQLQSLMLYTINFYHLPHMHKEKSKSGRKTQRQKPPSPSSGPNRTIKFNLSFDNLRPFVHTAHTPPKQPNYREFKNKRFRTASKTEESSEQQREIRVKSPDVAREASNVILKAIELRGIGCAWEDIEEVRSEMQDDRGEEGEETWRSGVWSDPPVEKNKSVASTNDQFSGYFPQMYQQNYVIYDYERRYYDPSYFVIDVGSISGDGRTTLMIKNIPNKYTIQSLAQEIDREHSNCYDFLYLPCDIKNNCNVGYGFINFLNTDYLCQFYHRFHNKRWCKFKSEKICNLTYARLQGLGSLIEHFQNSKVLNHKDKKYQPIIREFSSIDTLIQHQKASTSMEMS